jgi:hypothetical protein
MAVLAQPETLFATCATYGEHPQSRSDSVKLPFGIYMNVWLRFVGRSPESPAEAHDFQAEYEGSIPFTRSSPTKLPYGLF